MAEPKDVNPAHEEPDEEWLAEGAEILERWQAATQEGRTDEADALALEMMAFAAAHAKDLKNPQDPFYEQAFACEEAGDWEGAEAAYREAIEVAESPAMAYYARDKIVNLYLLLDRNAEALSLAEMNVEDARASELSMVLYMALHTVAVCADRAHRPEAAIQAADAALGALPDDLPVALQQARTITVRARARLDMDDLEEADTDLQAAWSLLEPQAAESAAGGYQAWHAAWWSAKAHLLAARGDPKGALDARWTALRHRTDMAQNPMLQGLGVQKGLAEAIHALGEAQQAMGDLASAAESFAEARALYREIGLSGPTD